MAPIERTFSESSDDIDIRPLELADLRRGAISEDEESDDERKASISGLSGSDKFFSVVYGLNKKKETTDEMQKKLRARMAWRNAYNKIKKIEDPWAKFNFEDMKTERAKRYRYKALQKKWVEDTVLVRIETKSFNHGAMRECFRMKKLSNFCSEGWAKALNYVAKRYIDSSTTRRTYFDDVKLQMDAKLWSEEYNRHNPPKKVDIFQMAIIEMTEREGSPLFHVEHFIDGSYTKYNSNSGFVSSKIRMTPHAFSHFSFEKSGHELIVVDVQGVGDLYTDPQIHTAHGDDYGDGNLGTRGMALFFHSHQCNNICKTMGLSEFDLAPSEKENLNKAKESKKQNYKTKVRGHVEPVIPVNVDERDNFHEFFRQRSMSSGCQVIEEDIAMQLEIGSLESLEDNFVEDSPEDAMQRSKAEESDDSAIGTSKRSPPNVRQRRTGGVFLPNPDVQMIRSISECSGDFSFPPSPPPMILPPSFRQRHDSSASECDSVVRRDLADFSNMILKRSRPSRIVSPGDQLQIISCLETRGDERGNLVLGQVHLDLAKYYELNRFNEDDIDFDKDAAIFHVKHSAFCGLVDGLLTAGQMLLGIPHYILPDIELPKEEQNETLGFYFLEEACRAGDRWALSYVANAFDTGLGLPADREKNYAIAAALYEKVISQVEVDDEGNYDAVMDAPPHLLRAKQAALYLKGGFGLDRDPNKAGELYSQAAELATEAMKGKLAAKYYMDAENAWMECEEEE